MFRIGSSKPIEMKPTSYVSKIKNFVPKRIVDDKEIIEELEKFEKKKIEDIVKEKNEEKKESEKPIPDRIIEIEKTVEDKMITEKINEIMKKKINEIIEKKADETPSQKPESLEINQEAKEEKNYLELKKLIENKLEKIDEIAVYIKENMIKNTKESDENEEEKESVKEENKLLEKKRKRKTYSTISDEAWKNLKNENTDLKDEHKKFFFSEGEDIYIDVKGRKQKANPDIIKNIIKTN